MKGLPSVSDASSEGRVRAVRMVTKHEAEYPSPRYWLWLPQRYGCHSLSAGPMPNQRPPTAEPSLQQAVQHRDQ